MASLTLTPKLTIMQKNADGTYTLTCEMNDATAVNRGYRALTVKTDGTVVDTSGNPTGTVLTTAQMTTLNNNWATYQTGINTIDAAGKFPF